MKLQKVIIGLFLLAFCTPFTTAQEAKKLPEGFTEIGKVEGLTEYKLANGLKVVLIPDASQPKVTVNCTIFVGSRHEGYGETGMAHLLEHMVFKGCPKFPNVPKALADHGANFNGTTWVDRTNYYETMPASDENLEFGIELEADRLMNSFIAREELMKEFTVVRSEFESGENDPERVLLQRGLATAYEWHNYGKSTIGNKTDIERVPIENLQAFYKKYYRPDNALLIVAGRFDQEKALALIAKHFGPLQNPKVPLPQTYTEEPAQDGEREVTLRRVGNVAVTGAVYHIPAASHPEFPACEILASVLSDEPNGRLYKALVETKLATSVAGIAFTWHDPSVMVYFAQMKPEKSDEVKNTFLTTLESLAEKPITDEEVERVKRQLLQQRERSLANSQAFAIGLSEWAACGDWRLFFLHRDRIEKVTAADVNAVAKKYLVRSNRTVGVYVPTKEAERAAVPVAPAITDLVANYKGREAIAKGEVFDPTPENVEARVQRGQLSEGVQYAFLPKKTRGETVNLNLSLRFGNLESLKGQVSAADFLGSMMLRGTTKKSRQEIKDEFDKLNASVSISSDLGVVNVTIQTKRANLPGVLTLLKEVLRSPSFPETEFAQLQREELDAIAKGKTEPISLAQNMLRRKLATYPETDPRYVPTLEENEKRVTTLKVEDIRKLYEQQVNGAFGQLAVVGDFDVETTKNLLDQALAGWKAKVPYERISREVQKPESGTVKILTPDKANSVFIAGLPVPMTDSDPNYAAMVIGNYVLGQAPLASRLSVRVRGEEGLSYGVGSQFSASPMEKNAAFIMFAITNPKNMSKVDTVIAEELNKFLKEGPSASEIEDAKRGYLQSLKVQRGNDGTLASQLSSALFAKRTFDYYADVEKQMEALQPGDIKRAFEALVQPKSLVIIQAGDFNKDKK